MKEGRIIKALSGFYYVKSDGETYACKGRGVFRKKNIVPLVGDYVVFDITNEGEGYITEIKKRTNEITRPPVANMTQAIIVSSITKPTFSSLLLDRFLVLIESKKIKPVIVITKMDLATAEEITEIRNVQKTYQKIGYTIELVSTKDAESLKAVDQLFVDETSVIVGQSGVGKSSFLNALNPELFIKTDIISESLGRGKHTTRHVELVEINGGLVADTPGFSALDFNDIESDELTNYFLEMKERKNQCHFRGCLHDKEPKCAVKQAVEQKEIERFRYEHYLKFLQEIQTRKPRY